MSRKRKRFQEKEAHKVKEEAKVKWVMMETTWEIVKRTVVTQFLERSSVADRAQDFSRRQFSERTLQPFASSLGQILTKMWPLLVNSVIGVSFLKKKCASTQSSFPRHLDVNPEIFFNFNFWREYLVAWTSTWWVVGAGKITDVTCWYVLQVF